MAYELYHCAYTVLEAGFWYVFFNFSWMAASDNYY